MSEALQKKDWKKARALSLRLSKEHNFAFLSPIIDGWISLGERKYAPPVLPEDGAIAPLTRRYRSEEHTSELQSLMRISYAVFCLTKKNHYNKLMRVSVHYYKISTKSTMDSS